jgi:hypothetical protein
MKKNGLIKGFSIYLDPLITSKKMNLLSLLLKVVPSKIKDVNNQLRKHKGYLQNGYNINPSSDFLPCIGDYNFVGGIVTNRALDMSIIINNLNKNPAIIDSLICNVLKMHIPIKKTLLNQLKKIVKKNG